MFRVEADASALISELRFAERGLPSAINQATRSVRFSITGLLEEVFSRAAEYAGEGFPEIYKEHLLQTIAQKGPEIITSGGVIEASFDLEELGTYDDLEEGFHYHALDSARQQIELPYQGEDLLNPLSDRYNYWVNRLTESTRQETYAARVTYWESRGVAPQWLLLNYGEAQFYPAIHPYPIVEELLVYGDRIIKGTVEAEIDNMNRATFSNFKQKPGTYIRLPNGRYGGSKRG